MRAQIGIGVRGRLLLAQTLVLVAGGVTTNTSDVAAGGGLEALRVMGAHFVEAFCRTLPLRVGTRASPLACSCW